MLLLKDGMGLRMKHFNIMGVYRKIQFLVGGGGSHKTNTQGGGELPKKGAWSVCRFKGWGTGQKRGSGVFQRGVLPQCPL